MNDEPTDINETFARLSAQDPYVFAARAAIQCGADEVQTLKGLVVALVDVKQELLTRLNYATSIAPRLVRLDGGKVVRWDCPSEFIRHEDDRQ